MTKLSVVALALVVGCVSGDPEMKPGAVAPEAEPKAASGSVSEAEFLAEAPEAKKAVSEAEFGKALRLEMQRICASGGCHDAGLGLRDSFPPLRAPPGHPPN